MKKKKRKRILLLCFVLMVVCLGIIYVVLNLKKDHEIYFKQGYINYGDMNIVTFKKIDDVTQYRVSLYENDKLIKEETAYENKIVFGDVGLKEGSIIKITITAYKKDKVKRVYNNFEYTYQKDEIRPVHVYISPSNQTDNLGVSRAGYTNESEMMNKVADVVYKRLKDHGYKVFRNNPDMDLKDILKESKEIGVNLHLALHSNAYVGDEQDEVWGIETWIYNEESMYNFANSLQKNLIGIYPYKYGNRGVKYSSEHFDIAEVNPEKVENGVLVELAFHDNYDDAKWISDNISKIGNKIADTVIAYYDNI